MTRITTGCPHCGRVELEVGEVTLVVSPREETAWYLFDCLSCARRIVKPAPTTVAVALTSVSTTVWTVPAEALERVAPHERPAITMDDVLDALLVLGADQDLTLAAGAGSGEPDPATGAHGPATLTPPRSDGAGSRPARPNAA